MSIGTWSSRFVSLSLLAVLLAGLASGAGAQEWRGFPSVKTYATGDGPLRISTGDINGDGIIDLATPNFSSDNVSFLLGVGGGNFATSVNIPVGESPSAIIIEDFNDDGFSDLATANWKSNDVSVLLGNGENTFAAAVNIPVGDTPGNMIIEDFNGDGFIDLATTNLGSNDISVLLGNGDGTFASRNFYAGMAPTSIVTGDFNGDGIVDIATLNSSTNEVTILIGLADSQRPGKGHGIFPRSVSFSTGSNPLYWELLDLNGDGVLDLVTLNYDSANLSILMGNEDSTNPGFGDGTFASPVNYPTGSLPSHLTVGDFNGDEVTDFIAVTTIPRGIYNFRGISVWFGNSDGSLSPSLDFILERDPLNITQEDFNGDGISDLAVSSQSYNDVTILLGNSSSDSTSMDDWAFISSDSYSSPLPPTNITAEDINDDDFIDLIITHTDWDFVSVLLGQRDGKFSGPLCYPAGGSNKGIQSGDFNNDGNLDLAVSVGRWYEQGISILLGHDDGTFATPASTYLITDGQSDSFFEGGDERQVVLGDFNGDGTIDILSTNYEYSSLSLLFGNGDGTFAPSLSHPVGLDIYYITTGDFNDDGINDLAAGAWRSGGDLIVWLATGDEYLFAPPIEYSVGWQITGIVSTDFNGDGIADLAASVLSENHVSVLLGEEDPFYPGRGNGTFKAPVNYPALERPFGLVEADFDDDGIIDLATANYASGGSVLFGNGDGTFAPQVYLPILGGRILTTGDFNGDGIVDIAYQKGVSEIEVLPSNGDRTFADPVSFVAGYSASWATSGDFNGDGYTDMASANSGNISILLNQGVRFSSPSTFTFTPQDQTTPNLAWNFVVPTAFDGTITGNFDDANERLQSVTSTNTGAFGFWESPAFEVSDSASDVTRGLFLRGEVGDESLFRAFWTLSSDDAVDVANLPTVRVRSGSSNYAVTSELLATSRGIGDFSPSATGNNYEQYFNLPAEDNIFQLSFDVINFDPTNAAVATLNIEEVTLEYIGRDALGSATQVANLDFAGDDNGFTARNASPDLVAPATFTSTADGLLIRGVEPSPARGVSSDIIFGFWGVETEVPFTGGKLYRVTWTIGSDAAAGQELEVPTFRLRVNDSSLKFASLLHVNSYDETARVPVAGSSQQYDLWLVAPDQIDGSSWNFSFDYLVVGGAPTSEDDPTIGLYLENINVEEYELD